MLAVLFTVATWYVGDAFYNHYALYHARLFTPGVLTAAWWEVALFLAAFLMLTPAMHGVLNGRQPNQSSQVVRLLEGGVGRPLFQSQLTQLFWGCAAVWTVLVILAVIRLKSQSLYFFLPFLAYRADPWNRGQIGSGIDALLALAGYFQLFVTSIFGVVAALAQNPRVRLLALAACGLTWPYYIFDRTRNTMLAIVLPAVLAWVFLRLRMGLLPKIIFLVGAFFLISTWFQFVLANRSDTTITAALHGEGLALRDASLEVHHEGLNMYEELCWVNTFILDGSYVPNRGARYFAELVNPIPRSLWPGKPVIGLDYAVARGQQYTEYGTTCTIATGMIGQGVVNFGRLLGPVFAAWLMSLWAAMLAGLDLRGERLGRIPLFVLGLILTFNLGRDITLITLYTFVFGALVVWWLDRANQPSVRRPPRRPGRSEPAGPPNHGTAPPRDLQTPAFRPPDRRRRLRR